MSFSKIKSKSTAAVVFCLTSPFVEIVEGSGMFRLNQHVQQQQDQPPPPKLGLFNNPIPTTSLSQRLSNANGPSSMQAPISINQMGQQSAINQVNQQSAHQGNQQLSANQNQPSAPRSLLQEYPPRFITFPGPQGQQEPAMYHGQYHNGAANGKGMILKQSPLFHSNIPSVLVWAGEFRDNSHGDKYPGYKGGQEVGGKESIATPTANGYTITGVIPTACQMLNGGVSDCDLKDITSTPKYFEFSGDFGENPSSFFDPSQGILGPQRYPLQIPNVPVRVREVSDGVTLYYQGEVNLTQSHGWAPHGQGLLLETRPEGNIISRGHFQHGQLHDTLRPGTKRLANGQEYTGFFQNGGAHGKGDMHFTNGNRYRGEFKNGDMSGKGRMTFPDGRVCDGSWQDGKMNGPAACVRATPYNGSHGPLNKVNGETNPPEIIASQNGINQQSGETLIIYMEIGNYVDDSMVTGYKGAWHKNLQFKNPPGHFNIDEFEQYRRGWRHGPGEEVWKNGKYEGNYRNDQRNGQGTYINAIGATYTGNWLNNKRHGHGKFISQGDQNLADTYTGDWSNDREHGQGTKTWANGDQYEGEWFQGLMQGFGIIHEKGKMHGQGLWERSRKYEGNWLNGLWHSEVWDSYYQSLVTTPATLRWPDQSHQIGGQSAQTQGYVEGYGTPVSLRWVNGKAIIQPQYDGVPPLQRDQNRRHDFPTAWPHAGNWMSVN